MKKLKHVLGVAVVGGLVAVEGAKLVFQLRASSDPDPASGRVEPVNLAPKISDDWDYISTTDMWIYGGLLCAFLLLFLAWAVVSLIARWRGPMDELLPIPLDPEGVEPPAASRRPRFRKLSFGKRGRLRPVDRSA